MNICSEFGKLLRQAREENHLTQKDLAKKVGISSQMVSAYEKQDRTPSLDVAANLAATLSVSLDRLCGIQVSAANDGEKLPAYIPITEGIKTLSLLAQYFGNSGSCSCTVKTMDRLEPAYYDRPDGTEDVEYTEKVAVFYIRHPELAEFIEKWSKMKTLLDEKTITEDLFSTWYNGEMSRLSECDQYNDAKSYRHPLYRIPLSRISSAEELFCFDIEPKEQI